MSAELIRDLVASTRRAVREHREELTALDRAIGDGDHGLNMARGFEAIAEVVDELAGMSLGKALEKAGMTLVMKVGGASGPLYGSLLMSMGRAAGDGPLVEAGVVPMLRAGVDAVCRRGKSTTGEKTMLDVLVPVLEALETAEGPSPAARARAAAGEGLEATRDMLATKGRASFLGDRSVGHLDPGARSSAILVGAVCDVIEARTGGAGTAPDG